MYMLCMQSETIQNPMTLQVCYDYVHGLLKLLSEHTDHGQLLNEVSITIAMHSPTNYNSYIA